MKNTLTILTEAEEIGVTIAQIEGEDAAASRKVADIEKALSDAVAAQQGVQSRLAKEKDGFEKFLSALPKNLPAEKVRKITQDRVNQLVEAGLLEGLGETEVSESPDTSDEGMSDDAEDAPSAQTASAEDAPSAQTADDAGEDLLSIDTSALDGDQQPSSSDDAVVALADKERPSPKGQQAKVDTPEFVDA